MLTRPWELRLAIGRSGDSYVASWIIPDEQETEPFNLYLPLDEEAAISIRWYYEDYLDFPGVGDRKHAEGIERRLEAWGKALYDALFTGRSGGRLEQRIDQMLADGRTVVLTLGSSDPEFHAQPWELLRTSFGPLVFSGVVVRRQLVGRRSFKQPRFALPLRVLLIVSRPDEAEFIDPRNSIRPLFEVLENWPDDTVDIEFCEPPTFQRLEELISESRKENRPFHIVHFDGHGKYLPETGVGALAFEVDEEGRKTNFVPGRTLGDLLSQTEIPLVLLEACRSSALSDRPVYSLVAPALLESGVGSVVAFSHAVHVEGARIFVERLYRELVDGLTVSEALGEARKAMFADRRRWIEPGPDGEVIELQDWGIAQLYQVGEDPALIAPEREASGPATGLRIRRDWKERFLGDFPPEPMYAFHGRAAELLKLERLFRSSIGVLISGMGGMGKTALSCEAAAWWLRTGRFETAIFHSFERKAGVVDIIGGIGTAFEGEDFLRLSHDEQRRRATKYFQSRKVLLIWDNFESTLAAFQKGDLQIFDAVERKRLRDLFEDLTEGEPAGRILVTCRPETTGLKKIGEMALQGLWRIDSLRLLAAILKKRTISTDSVGWERTHLHDLLSAVADHPLSISLIAPHLGERNPIQIRDDLQTDLLQFKNLDAEESRNRSLFASLEFSKRRLSASAKDALASLAWFEGGVFERFFLEFAEISEDLWLTIREELASTALLRVEDPPWAQSPYLQFHPTLRYAASSDAVDDPLGAEGRFYEVYLQVREWVEQALRGARPSDGMALLRLEEANFRAALERSISRPDQETWKLTETLGVYLTRAGRLREREALTNWVREHSPETQKFDMESFAATVQQAQELLRRGDGERAVAVLNELIRRIEADDDELLQAATAYGYLGQFYVETRRFDLAHSASEHSIELWERLLSDLPDDPEVRQSEVYASMIANLAVAIGTHSNSLYGLGRYEEALEICLRAVEISRRLGDERSVAVGLGQTAQILVALQRWSEAEKRYEEAVAAACIVEDLVLEGAFVQHQASLKRERGKLPEAVILAKKSLKLFRRARHADGEMQTMDLLGGLEMDQGLFDEAEAWYLRSRELADARNDEFHLSVVAQHLGILDLRRAERADGEAERVELLKRAVGSLEQSLKLDLRINNRLGAGQALFQLGVVHRSLRDFGRAERNLRQSLEVLEPLQHPSVYKHYFNLAEVARDRGDLQAETEWRAKYDAKLKELESVHRDDVLASDAL